MVEKKVDEEVEKKKRREEYIRTYVSPWERAMKGDEDLVATMKSSMPGPIQIHLEPPTFKSFNRYRKLSTTQQNLCESQVWRRIQNHLQGGSSRPAAAVQLLLPS